MHFEILVEDASGKVALEILMPKILDADATFSIYSYKGIGHIPKGIKSKHDPQKRILLDQLPRLLAGYGKLHAKYPEDYKACVIVVCDLDHRDLKKFISELNVLLANCNPQPLTKFCIAVEEGEAWLLGHKEAIETAYPLAKKPILKAYQYDKICGTWETLANIVYPGGVEALLSKGKLEAGRLKSVWASEIMPLVDIQENKSPSFQHFVKAVTDML